MRLVLWGQFVFIGVHLVLRVVLVRQYSFDLDYCVCRSGSMSGFLVDRGAFVLLPANGVQIHYLGQRQ